MITSASEFKLNTWLIAVLDQDHENEEMICQNQTQAFPASCWYHWWSIWTLCNQCSASVRAEKWDKAGGAAPGRGRTGPVRGFNEAQKIKQKNSLA